MRDFSPAAQAFFASRAKGHRVDLFTLTLEDGTIYRTTSLDRVVTYGGDTWIATGPSFQRTSMNVRNTAEVPQLEIRVSALDNDFTGGTNIKLAIYQGDLDGARIRYELLPLPTAPDPFTALDTSLGPPVTMFDGRVGEIQLDAQGAIIRVDGDVSLLAQSAPRNLHTSSCQHRFCDAGCTLSAATFTTTGCDVGAGSTTLSILWGGTLPATPALAALGQVTFTTGANAGHKRSIVFADGTSFLMAYPLWFPPATGDLFDLFQGCDKLLATCTVTYNNRANFRGFTAVPDASYAA